MYGKTKGGRLVKVEARRRLHADHSEHHHDLVLVAENNAESSLLDLLADLGASRGEPVRVRAEVRVSDDFQEHYVLLQPLEPAGTQGTRVTCEDVETGDTEVQVVRDNYVVVTDGRCYVDHVNEYPGTGTVQLTLKRRREAIDGT